MDIKTGLAFLGVSEWKSTTFRRHSHHSWRLPIICSVPATSWVYSHLGNGHFVSLHNEPVEDRLHTGSSCVKWRAINSWGVQLGNVCKCKCKCALCWPLPTRAFQDQPAQRVRTESRCWPRAVRRTESLCAFYLEDKDIDEEHKLVASFINKGTLEIGRKCLDLTETLRVGYEKLGVHLICCIFRHNWAEKHHFTSTFTPLMASANHLQCSGYQLSL